MRSRLDYGAVVYGSARPSALKMLDPVHHLGLRLATGAFRTSPVLSLYVESNQLSLEKRRQYLSLAYAYKVLAEPDHPAYSSLQDSRFTRLYENKPSIVQPLTFRLDSLRQLLNLGLDEISLFQKAHSVAPWDMQPILCDWSLTKFNKQSVSPVVIQQEFLEVQKRYSDYMHFYTDGAKTSTFVGCAVYSEPFRSAKRLDTVATIFTAELYGVLTAVEYVIESQTRKAVLFVDSQSVITAIISVKSTKNYLVQLVRSKVNWTLKNGYDIKICWVPSHVGLKGNEEADRLAASSKNIVKTSVPLPYQDLKGLFKSTILQKWQSEWDLENNNKLHTVKPVLGPWESSSHKERFNEVLHCRLRIGHSYITHGYLLQGADPPLCEHCNETLTVWHILGLCTGLAQQRHLFSPEFLSYHIPFHPSLLLGEPPLIPFKRVLAFLEKTGLLHKF